MNLALTPHTLSAAQAAGALGTDSAHGLSSAEAAARLSQEGPNRLEEEPPPALWRRLLAQFRSLLVLVLAAAALIAGALGEWVDAIAILAIVLLNGFFSFLQEERAGRSLAALRALAAPAARVIRGGHARNISSVELVAGDRIEIEVGDHVPADARLLETRGLRLQEAALTGESEPVDKDGLCLLDATTPLSDRRNMVYMGTVVAAGRASALVTATGMRTELGRIAGLLEAFRPEPTPLQRRLEALGRVLVVVCLALVALIFALSLLRGGSLFEVFLVSVSLAVAAVPEGLPAVVTVALALGLQRMARRNALVRKLPSVETLGSVTVICTDKTGTLTRGEMTVRTLEAGGVSWRVTGSGYEPHGEILRADGETADAVSNADLRRLLEAAALCNDARVAPRPAPLGGEGGWDVVGDPTEGALLVAALKGKVIDARGEQPVVFEIPFDPTRKAMTVVRRTPNGEERLYSKGAPEVILARCDRIRIAGQEEPLTETGIRRVLDRCAAMARDALRVLAVAYRGRPEPREGRYEETDLVFAGLAGLMDPPRDEARIAVRQARQAGIHVVMITGDHPDTALSIARELGIAGPSSRLVNGVELDALSDADLASRVAEIPVYARVTAEHKLRIVRAWKARGDVVAMTGDGVNDAPAVKAADIGIAMGRSGTDVTREASDMVLADDNFASIVHAIEEGRGIFENLQKILLYLLSCNAGEILVMLAASLVGWPAPLLPIQLLWVNLVTDGFPALALSMERPEPDAMFQAPRAHDAPLLSGRMGLAILIQGFLVGTASLCGFWALLESGDGSLARARTGAFCVLAFAQLPCAIAARSRTRTAWSLGFFSNSALLWAVVASALLQLSVATLPFAQPVFETSSRFGWEWWLIAGLSLSPAAVIETWKVVRRRRRR